MTLDNVLTTISIAITSLTAGSIFCFPLFGPSLTRDLGLNLTQTNTIWAGAVLGEYLSAAPWGALGDHYGPRILSLSAGIIFLVGYQLMSHAENIASIERHASNSTEPYLNRWSFTVTVISFVLVGSGVAASYFSAVTTSTRLFKSKPGLAIAGPLTLFSLSSLFLTYLGTTFFTNSSGDLDASKFLAFLGILCGSANIFSAFVIKLPPQSGHQPQTDAPNRADGRRDDDESTPLIQDRNGDQSPRISGVPEGQGVVAFMTTPSVWALALLMVVGVGAAEMVLGSVGNMVVALLGTSTTTIGSMAAASPVPSIGPVALSIRAQQVKLLAAANAFARLAGGFLSDLVAPKAQGGRRSSTEESSASNIQKLVSRIEISRITLLLFATLMALGAYLWAAFGLTSTDGLAAFSVIVGTSYGLMFSIVPAVTVSAFGPAHFGRNWGLLSYCCAIGSASYSLLYATVSDAIAAKYGNQHGGQGGTCLAGPECFRASFVISALGLAASLLALIPVWKRWRWFI
ncbi:unnamed protein product [Sympodiomycopsis kandeliae]